MTDTKTGVHTIGKVLQEKADQFEKELLEGYKAVQRYEKTITFFGSARFTEDNDHYKAARELSSLLCKEGYTIITGGGGGIMEAGNRGSQETCNSGVGFNIELPAEQTFNKYVTHNVTFNFFASRKMAMYFSGEAYIFFPGGYGTLDEFFQILTLIQTHKAPEVPVICIGADYWNKVKQLANETLLVQEQAISPDDLNLFTITDDLSEAVRIVNQ